MQRYNFFFNHAQIFKKEFDNNNYFLGFCLILANYFFGFCPILPNYFLGFCLFFPNDIFIVTNIYLKKMPFSIIYSSWEEYINQQVVYRYKSIPTLYQPYTKSIPSLYQLYGTFDVTTMNLRCTSSNPSLPLLCSSTTPTLPLHLASGEIVQPECSHNVPLLYNHSTCKVTSTLCGDRFMLLKHI